MATLTASGAASGVQPIACNGLNVVHGQYTLANSSSAGDVIQMVKVPAGARIVGGRLTTSGIGLTGATVGDGGSTTRYTNSASFSSTTIQFNSTTQDYSYSVADTIDVKINSVGTGTAAGTYYLTVFYTFNQGDAG